MGGATFRLAAFRAVRLAIPPTPSGNIARLRLGLHTQKKQLTLLRTAPAKARRPSPPLAAAAYQPVLSRISKVKNQ